MDGIGPKRRGRTTCSKVADSTFFGGKSPEKELSNWTGLPVFRTVLIGTLHIRTLHHAQNMTREGGLKPHFPPPDGEQDAYGNPPGLPADHFFDPLTGPACQPASGLGGGIGRLACIRRCVAAARVAV